MAAVEYFMCNVNIITTVDQFHREHSRYYVRAMYAFASTFYAAWNWDYTMQRYHETKGQSTMAWEWKIVSSLCFAIYSPISMGYDRVD